MDGGDIFLEKIMTEGFIKLCLEYTKDNYRRNEVSWKNYIKILSHHKKNGDIFEVDFHNLIHDTLCSWNMNQRRAKLVDKDSLHKQIINNKETITQLQDYSLKDFDSIKQGSEIYESIKTLFNDLNITETKTKIVALSKTLHFLLPQLFAPIDGNFTLSFLYNSAFPFYNQNKDQQRQNEFDGFITIHEYYSCLLKLDAYKKAKLPQSDQYDYYHTKQIDDIVIGFIKMRLDSFKSMQKVNF